MTLRGYDVTMAMTETYSVNHVLEGMQMTLIHYSVTMETAGPDSISCNHREKVVERLTWQELLGYATARKCVLVCVSTDKSANITWDLHGDEIYKTARKGVRKIF